MDDIDAKYPYPTDHLAFSPHFTFTLEQYQGRNLEKAPRRSARTAQGAAGQGGVRGIEDVRVRRGFWNVRVHDPRARPARR